MITERTRTLAARWLELYAARAKAKVKPLRFKHGKWCQCGNPSERVTFFDDNQNRTCPKHHYCCDDCGAVVQVG